MIIGIASDHRGFILKGKVINYLKEKGYTINDYGTNSEESTDYPIYAFKVGEAIRDNIINFGIVICGSGIGVCIACNKVKNVKCAKVNNMNDAELSRLHNNANVIAIDEDLEDFDIIDKFLETQFSNEDRHKRRVELIDSYVC